MKKIGLCLLPMLLLFSGCYRILFTYYGIKDPKVENETSIKKKLLKYKMDTTNVVTVSSNDFISVLSDNGIPNGAIFDKNGNYIEYRETDSACNAGLYQFIPELNVHSSYTKTGKTTLEQEVAKLRDYKGNPVTLSEDADFYLLLYWTVHTGRLTKDHIKVWEESAKKNPNCSIKVLKVNLDAQEYWDEQAKKELIKSLKIEIVKKQK